MSSAPVVFFWSNGQSATAEECNLELIDFGGSRSSASTGAPSPSVSPATLQGDWCPCDDFFLHCQVDSFESHGSWGVPVFFSTTGRVGEDVRNDL